jgi:hypothetical protein
LPAVQAAGCALRAAVLRFAARTAEHALPVLRVAARRAPPPPHPLEDYAVCGWQYRPTCIRKAAPATTATTRVESASPAPDRK